MNVISFVMFNIQKIYRSIYWKPLDYLITILMSFHSFINTSGCLVLLCVFSIHNIIYLLPELVKLMCEMILVCSSLRCQTSLYFYCFDNTINPATYQQLLDKLCPSQCSVHFRNGTCFSCTFVWCHSNMADIHLFISIMVYHQAKYSVSFSS